jgi:hypothetical protein
MVGIGLACSAGPMSFGTGWESISAGRGGGNGADAVLETWEPGAGKVRSAEIRAKAQSLLNFAVADFSEQRPRAIRLIRRSFFLKACFRLF